MKKTIVCTTLFMLSMAANLVQAKSLLIVATNVDTIPNTETKTGLWAEELIIPHNVFAKNAYEITIASPKGGIVPVDVVSTDAKVIGEEVAKEVSEVSAANFDAIFVAGGHGVMWDIATDKGLAQITADFFKADKFVSSVCHGPAFLANAKDEKGNFLIQGYKVTGFSNKEEAAIKMTEIVPFSLEDDLQKASNNKYSSTDKAFSSYVVQDRKLITGQNPASSRELAETLLKALSL